IMQTRAVVFRQKEGGSGGDFEINETFECPEQDDHSVTVKVKACGLSANSQFKEFFHYSVSLLGVQTFVSFQSLTWSAGILMTQLAQSWGAKVLATASTEEECLFLESLQPPLTKVIDLRKPEMSLVDTCMIETGGLGIDCVVDNGVAMYSDEFTEHLTESELDKVIGHHPGVPWKQDIIACLAVGGRWVTSQSDLQLDPPDSKLLYAKCASVSFAFEDVWTLSRGNE
ncbi:hypothetical protein QZH41_019713, partial [Actinostola sp. cb2023]